MKITINLMLPIIDRLLERIPVETEHIHVEY